MNTNHKELLQCPFCGSAGEIVESRECFPNMPLVYYPTCTREDINYSCPAEAQPDGETNSVGCSYSTREEAIEAWNNRVDANLRKKIRVELLEELMEDLPPESAGINYYALRQMVEEEMTSSTDALSRTQ